MPEDIQFDLTEMVHQIHNYGLDLVAREVYLHSYHNAGQVDEEGGIEYRMATQVIKNLHLLDQLEEANILIHLQCPGGDWTHGMSIYDAIENSRSKVIMLAYGEVSSMSGVVLQAAAWRVMMPNCEFLVHRGFLTLEGIATTVQSNMVWNKKIDEKMLRLYAHRCVHGKYFKDKKMNQEQVMGFIDRKIKRLGDWNLSAQEAIDFGLADCVFGSNEFETIKKIKERKYADIPA